MPYSLQLVSINTATFGLSRANAHWGFPLDTPFHTILMSYWMCGPADIHGISAGVGPSFHDAGFFDFNFNTGSIDFRGGGYPSSVIFYNGSFTTPAPPGQRRHVMMSVDTLTQTVQLYINDQNIPVTGTWIGTPPFNFRILTGGNIWRWTVEGPSPGLAPAMGDAWVSNTPSFVDLSIAANRRKFIAVDLTPVDLGDTGTNPFGYQPAMYMSVRAGGVPNDILLNRGAGGGAWSAFGGWTPTFQDPGACTLPPLPPTTLVMDNVVATTEIAPLSVNLVSLAWSDDRGHHFGSPVTQPIGQDGQYVTSLQWQRLGMARDRVFEASWSVPMHTALQGAWLTAEPADADEPPKEDR